MPSSARPAWPPRWWAAAVAWALWILAMLGLAATARFDQLLRQPVGLSWPSCRAGVLR